MNCRWTTFSECSRSGAVAVAVRDWPKIDRMRHSHADGRVVDVLDGRVRDPDADAFPDACADAEIEQCSAANRVCSRDGAGLVVDSERRAVGERLFLPLPAEADVEEEPACRRQSGACACGRPVAAPATKSTPRASSLRVRINVSILDHEQSKLEKTRRRCSVARGAPIRYPYRAHHPSMALMDAPSDSKRKKRLVHEEKLGYHASHLKASPRCPITVEKFLLGVLQWN